MRKRLSVIASAMLFILILSVSGAAESQDQGWQDFPEWIVSQEEYRKTRDAKVRGLDVTGRDKDVTSDQPDSSLVTQPATEFQSSRVMVGVVTEGGVNCRKGPSLYEPVVYQFREGSYVKLDDFKDGWYQVVIDGPVVGWITSKYVRVGENSGRTGDCRFDEALARIVTPGQETMKVGTVTGNNVNVRMGPTLDDPFVSRAFKGELLLVEEERDGWCKIRWIFSRTGWIHESLVKEISQVEGMVLSAGADIRLGPGTEHDLVRRVLRGMKFPVINVREGWFKVALPTGQVGFISAVDFEPPASLKGADSGVSANEGVIIHSDQ